MKPLPTPYDAEIEQLAMRLRRLKIKARRHRLAERQRQRWAEPEYRDRLLATLRSPEHRKQAAASSRAGMATPEQRAARSERMRAQWADPAMAERMRAGLSVAHKARNFGRLADPVEKQIFGGDARA